MSWSEFTINDDGNVTLRFQRRLATETGNTYNPTLGTSRDWAQLVIAVDEVNEPAAPVVKLLAATGVG